MLIGGVFPMTHVRGFWSGRGKNTPLIGWIGLVVSFFVLTGCGTSGGQTAPGAEPASPVTAFLGKIEQDFAGLTGTKPTPPPSVPTPSATVPAADPPPAKLWGAETVWRTNLTADACPPGRGNGACLLQAMTHDHASAHAIAFARRMGLNGYLGEFHAYGRVDLGTVTYPFFANDNQAPVLLNGTPPILDVWKIAQKVDLRADPALRGLLARERGLALSDDPPRFISEHARPDGGQSFLFQIELSQCHACAPAARPRLSYDFDKNGRFLGAD